MLPEKLYIDMKNDIYVSDFRKFHVFNAEGQFIKSIPVSYDMSLKPFGVATEGNIFLVSSSALSDKKEMILIDKNGEETKKITGCITGKLMSMDSDYKVRHLSCPDYMPDLHFSMLSSTRGIYGCSSEYRLYCIDSDGSVEYIIEKEEKPEPISIQEKKEAIDHEADRLKSGPINISKKEVEKVMEFPDYKTFFDSMISDDIGNIYVHKGSHCSGYREGTWFDFFNSQGFYLYRVNFPVHIQLLKNQKAYKIFYDHDTGYIKIKRYEIKNWDQLKKYTPEQ